MVVELQKERGQTLPPTAGWLRGCDGGRDVGVVLCLVWSKSRDVGPVAQRARLTFFLPLLNVGTTTSGYTAIPSFPITSQGHLTTSDTQNPRTHGGSTVQGRWRGCGCVAGRSQRLLRQRAAIRVQMVCAVTIRLQ